MAILSRLGRAFGHRPSSNPDDLIRWTNAEWQRQLAEAGSSAERADIDAMFAAALA